MTNNTLELSRRKVLAGLGGVGLASTGAGLGTTAFFSDTETFRDSQLVAGELDMLVDWEEHYSDWSVDENDDRTDDFGGDETDLDGDGDTDDDGTGNFEVLMTDGDPTNVPDGYTGLPTPMVPLVAVPDEFVDDFMMNTAIEAFPDEDDDGIQDTIYTRDQLSKMTTLSPEEIEEEFRSQFANVPDELDSDLRTESSRGDPLVYLQDVKPGDFGEVTFSLHLFNNPGYIWFDAEILENADNGMTEPEEKDDDESGTNANGNNPGELLDAIHALVWHDDGDNVLEPTEVVYSPHDVDSDSTIDLTGDERIVAHGTLRDVLESAADGGIPLDADTRTTERDCYPNSTTRYVCFAWWLPVDHANEIQTDSIGFDLGFYTEQCRHNDGSRMPSE
ncbi:hypothetical protein [Haloarcula sp. JP-L23]|uniref:hypothetical protein n=1 Tax=Haloarcula sp. JP-L23 TaxID=2716717 RepID=UPI00140EF5FB|nr:hypothetical protein G9465_18545 [Haloarcula sp. JP-L23]